MQNQETVHFGLNMPQMKHFVSLQRQKILELETMCRHKDLLRLESVRNFKRMLKVNELLVDYPCLFC